MQLPLISIITVVYNDIAHIVETLDSVTTQDYPQIEYIIIDGASSDGTREKIMEYIASNAVVDSKKCEEQKDRIYLEATHKEKGLCFKFLSEADTGIYDAMNKGIDLATGEWCNFMNCGDRFYNSHTILELFTRFLKKNTNNTAAIYGDTMFCLSQNHNKIPRIKSNPAYRMPFCHQSVFVKTSLLKQHHFDTSFRICADNAFFTTIYNKGQRFCYIDMIVSICDAYGLSSKPSWQYFKEEVRIIARYNIFYLLPFCLKYLSMVIKFSIKSILPSKLSLKIQSMYNAK